MLSLDRWVQVMDDVWPTFGEYPPDRMLVQLEDGPEEKAASELASSLSLQVGSFLIRLMDVWELGDQRDNRIIISVVLVFALIVGLIVYANMGTGSSKQEDVERIINATRV